MEFFVQVVTGENGRFSFRGELSDSGDKTDRQTGNQSINQSILGAGGTEVLYVQWQCGQ